MVAIGKRHCMLETASIDTLKHLAAPARSNFTKPDVPVNAISRLKHFRGARSHRTFAARAPGLTGKVHETGFRVEIQTAAHFRLVVNCGTAAHPICPSKSAPLPTMARPHVSSLASISPRSTRKHRLITCRLNSSCVAATVDIRLARRTATRSFAHHRAGTARPLPPYSVNCFRPQRMANASKRPSSPHFHPAPSFSLSDRFKFHLSTSSSPDLNFQRQAVRAHLPPHPARREPGKQRPSSNTVTFIPVKTRQRRLVIRHRIKPVRMRSSGQCSCRRAVVQQGWHQSRDQGRT